MAYAFTDGFIGSPQLTPYNLPDTTPRMASGFIAHAVDPYWGGGEFIYVKAGGTTRQFGLLVITPAISNGKFEWVATEAPNTANLGRSLAVGMVPATVGQYFWACIGGVVPVNCSASVAADTAFGIVAAGQGGAIANGKQIVNGRVVLAAAATVAKANCVANSGSTRLQISGADGWFAGAYLSGTGIAAGTTVTDISPDGTQVTLSLATTAAVNGTVTATYNNATVYYNVAFIQRPFAQGQVT